MNTSPQVERLSLVGGGRTDSLLRQAFDLAADGLAVLEVSGPLARIVLANAALGRTLQASAATLAGDPLQSWLHPSSATQAQAAIALTVATGEAQRLDLCLVATDGAQCLAHTVLRRLDDADAARVLATFTDIGSQKALEDAIDTLPVHMVGLDRELRIAWLNASAARALGRSAAELAGRSWFEALPSVAPRRPIYERTLAGEAFDFERVELVAFDGKPQTLATSLRPLKDRNGHTSGVLVMARDLDTLLRAEDHGRQLEHRLSVLVEKCQDVITVLSREGTVDYQSPGGQRLLGYSVDEIVGRNVFELAHPDDLPDLRQRFAAHLADPKRLMAQPAEVRIRHKGGGWVWVELVATNAFDDPAIRGLVMVARGIDRRKAVEAEIAANRAMLDFALDAARIGAWDYDVLTGVHRFDARCNPLIGGADGARTVSLEALAQMTHPDDLARSRIELLRHIKGETPWYEIEYRARIDDGPWYWVYARGRVSARSGDGRATRLSGVMMGINEQRRAEIELREVEHRLEAALWGGQVAFWNWNADGNMFVSDSWLALAGYSRVEWVGGGMRWGDRVHADDRARALAAVESFIAGETEALDVEYRFQTRCGDWIWAHSRARTPERDAKRRALRVYGTTIDITAQKKMREFLEETQAAASVGGWEVNLRTQALTWTTATYALFDTTPSDYTPSMATVFELYDPASRPQLEAALEGAVARGEAFDLEVRARTLKGRDAWMRIVGKAERADGQTVRIFGAKQDITALKQAEEARRAALAVQRAVTDNAPDWLIMVDPQLRVQFSNRPLRGVPVDQVIGRNGLELLDPAVGEQMRAACARALADQRPSRLETYEHLPSGEWAHLEYLAAPVIQDGRAIGLSVRVTNVTERKLAEERLRTQARVLETMREGVVLFRTDGEIRIANPATDRLFGVAAGSLVGATVARLGLATEAIGRLSGGTPPDHDAMAHSAPREWLAHRTDGTEFLIEGVFSPVEFEGEPMIIGVLQDVTDRRQLERAIIEASSFEQQRFSSDLHDGLGQELTGISLLLRAATSRLPEDPEQGASLVRDASALIEGAIQSLRALAHGLAPVALELGGLPGALSDLTQRVRRSYGIRAQFRKHVEVPLRLDSAQSSHLYRIAQECISNAVRHGKATFITVRLASDAREVRLEIIDNGSGMPVPERRSTQGMGLRIMEYRARMLGGELRIENPRRGGTAVCCCVPLAPAADAAGTAGPA